MRLVVRVLIALLLIIGAAFPTTQSGIAPALAWTHGSAATTFNGGKSQAQSWFLFAGNDWPFIDHMKQGQSPVLGDGSGSPAPNTLDANGFPISISNLGVTWTFQIEPNASYSGNWVMKWTGGGTLVSGADTATVTTNGCTDLGNGGYSGTNCKIVVSKNSDFSSWSIRESAITTGITSLAVYRSDDETAYNAGEIFSPRYVAKWVAANIGVVRWLDWSQVNVSNMAAWNDRKPEGYACYLCSEFRAAKYGGVTAGTGDNYTLTCISGSECFGGGGPVDKELIIVHFDRSASSNVVTFNLNGTGAKSMVREDGFTLDGSRRPGAGGYGTLFYDADLGHWLLRGGGIATADTGIVNGVPNEVLLKFAMKIRAHPYFNIPPYAMDPMTDYVTQLATLVKTTGPSWMIPRFEPANEVWNFGFYVIEYANFKADAHWSDQDDNQWYGKVLSTVGQAVSAVYANDRTKYMVLGGAQTSLGPNTQSNLRFNSPEYVMQAAAPQVGYTKTAASAWATHGIMAPYYNAAQLSASLEITAAYSYANGVSSALTNYLASVNNAGTTGQAQFALPNLKTLEGTWFANFNGVFGLGMTAYEGGFDTGWNGPGIASANTNIFDQGDLNNGTDGYAGIKAISSAASAVLTLGNDGDTPVNAFSAVVGQSIKITGVTAPGWTGLNGNTYTVSSVSGNLVTVNANTSGFTGSFNNATTITASSWANPGVPTFTFTTSAAHGISVGASFMIEGETPSQYNSTRGPFVAVTGTTGSTIVATGNGVPNIDPGPSTVQGVVTSQANYVGSWNQVSSLRRATIQHTDLKTYTLTSLNDFVTQGGIFPSLYNFSGAGEWSAFNPNIDAPSPEWDGITQFNH